jgi:glyoxylase-like metal-dependent hydrolase (beta-lactamase superfamily II)
MLALLVAVSALAGLAASPPADAAAPMVKTSAPGYHRILLGKFEITALSDGTTELPVDQLLSNTTPAAVNAALARSFLRSPLESSFNGYLVNTGTKLVLIDTGAGTLFSPTLGKLVANLKAAGYTPEQVDEIYITHMHPDHVGGLVADGKIVFPNAVVRAAKPEADYWLSETNLAKAPADSKGFFQGAMTALNPYVKSGQFKPFEADGELVPGVRSVATFGHTAGHTNYVVESDGQKLVVWGDLIHVAAVQFKNPTVTIHFDTDSKKALRERLKAFNAAADGGFLAAGAHLPFPGIGHLRHDGKGYLWIPVNYTVMR